MLVRFAGSSRSPRRTASAKSLRSSSAACSKEALHRPEPSVCQRNRASGGRPLVSRKRANASRMFRYYLRSTSGCGSKYPMSTCECGTRWKARGVTGPSVTVSSSSVRPVTSGVEADVPARAPPGGEDARRFGLFPAAGTTVGFSIRLAVLGARTRSSNAAPGLLPCRRGGPSGRGASPGRERRWTPRRWSRRSSS